MCNCGKCSQLILNILIELKHIGFLANQYVPTILIINDYMPVFTPILFTVYLYLNNLAAG